MTDLCEHVQAFAKIARDMGIKVWGEHTEEPFGWVNVTCDQCGTVYETDILYPEEDDD